MANRIVLLGVPSAFLSLLLVIAGCQDSTADDNLPPPSFHVATIQPPPQYQPLPAPRYTPAAPVSHPAALARITPAPQRHRTFADAVPASWIPHVRARDWQWIVIHHTATSFGNEAIVNRWHIDRGFDEMGYHFLIGNGTNSGDGQVEVGPRWPKQKWGAHTKTPDNRFNDFGIGICLVGNFDVQYPSAAQMRSLDRLVAYLMKTYHIPPDHVLGHNNCKSTDCPGRHLSVALVRRRAVEILAAGGDTFPEQSELASSSEMIHDASAK
jgi:hypothetical protein